MEVYVLVNKKDIIIRSNGEGRIFKIDPNNPESKYSLPINSILKQHYKYILNSMNKENLTLSDDEECMIFKEIVLIDKVVGFSTYKGADANNPCITCISIHSLLNNSPFSIFC